MQVTVVRPADLGEVEAVQWRSFQDSSLMMSHPFFSLSYVKAWGMVNANARVTVVEDNGRIEAFIPYEIGDGRIATAIGGTHTYVDGIVSAGAPLEIRAIIKKSGLRGWRFTRAPEGQKVLDPYRYHGANDHRLASYVDLSKGYDSYLSDLRDGVKKRIAKTEKSRRSLQRAAGSVSFDWRNSKSEYFDQLIGWKSAQYENVRDWNAKALPVIRELILADNDDCRGLVSVLFAGEQAAAVTLCLEGPSIVAGWIMGFNPEFSRFSVGTAQLLDLIRGSAEHGIKMLDLGADYTATTDNYKDRFGNATYEVGGGGVWTSRLGAAARSLYRTVKYRD